MHFYTLQQARAFAAQWLPAWTGNDPARLLQFYADDAFYLDPAIPDGVRGKAALLAYFSRLLERNPAWVWRQIDAIPLEHGFLNKWQATIPVGSATVVATGVCLVQFDAAGRIARNEVYFDRHPIFSAWGSERQRDASGAAGICHRQ